MGLSVKREGGGFQKLVFENVLDTLPGGLVLDLTGYASAVNGYIPEGTLVGRTTATGLGKVIADPATPGAGVQILGLTYRSVKAEDNAMVGVVLAGIARLKAMPATPAGLAAALPRITLV